MEQSRSKNATLNIIVGWGSQFAILALSFISRKIFLMFLSVDYLGINGLYSNILSVLSLAELGLGHVMQFYLYKPVAENDYEKINSLMKYFRKLYIFIALTVLAIGFMLIPFLQFIINSELQQIDLIKYYILFLVNSCITYFSADKIALLAANQDNRLTKYISLSINIILQFVHIIVLAVWHNYTVYVLITLLSNVVNAILTNMLCIRRYPYLKEKNSVKSKIDKKYILNNLSSTFLYKIGATIVNSTDNILISVMVSTAAVGLYSNYYMVVSGVQAFVAVVTTSLISGIGNLSASNNKKRMNEVFNLMLFFYHFIAAYIATSFFLLFNDFIPWWLGKEYMLDNWTVFAIALAFYVTNAVNPIWMFREANGLFSKVKYLLLITAGCNIIFSVILGKFMGVSGILLATTIARIATLVWYEPSILFQTLFEKSSKSYWIKQLKYVILSIISTILCFAIQYALPHGFIFIVIKGVLFLPIFAFVFLSVCRKDAEVVEFKNIISKFIKRK